MADQIISIKIPSDKVQTALSGILKLYPNSEKNIDETPKYTDKQWVEELVKRYLRREIRRGRQIIANELAYIQEDDSFVI